MHKSIIFDSNEEVAKVLHTIADMIEAGTIAFENLELTAIVSTLPPIIHDMIMFDDCKCSFGSCDPERNDCLHRQEVG